MFCLNNAGALSFHSDFDLFSYLSLWCTSDRNFYIYRDAYVSSIVLYTSYIIVLPFLGECPTMCGIVDAGAYKLTAFVLPPATMSHSNTLATPQNRLFLCLGQQCSLTITLLAVWDSFLCFFFRGLIKLARTHSAG